MGYALSTARKSRATDVMESPAESQQNPAESRKTHPHDVSKVFGIWSFVVIERALLVSEGMKRKKLLNGLKGG